MTIENIHSMQKKIPHQETDNMAVITKTSIHMHVSIGKGP